VVDVRDDAEVTDHRRVGAMRHLGCSLGVSGAGGHAGSNACSYDGGPDHPPTRGQCAGRARDRPG
jgi:hypothetical protein